MKYKDPITGEYKELFLKTSDTYPIGAITLYGDTEAPTNWLICDGQELSRSEYKELFNVIGESFGAGDGSTTFNIPDFTDEAHLIGSTQYIIKASKSVGTLGNVVNVLSNSSNDTYSANYVNDIVKTKIKYNEVFDTHEYLEGNRVYGYIIEITGGLTKDVEVSVPLPSKFANKIEKIWIDLSNSFYDNHLITEAYNTRAFTGGAGNAFKLAITQKKNLVIEADDNWSDSWTFSIMIKFTQSD